ncbi:hypothetical protein TNCV_481521 [Trichonephila clavipes]|nr:hypothetical protein TNCV_481521 [Trichonephila clavipes]
MCRSGGKSPLGACKDKNIISIGNTPSGMQSSQEGTKQLNSAVGTKQLNSSVGTKQLNSSVGTKQLNSALPSTACNRLQPPTTACNRLQPPTTANRLQPPTTACNRLQPPATAYDRHDRLRPPTTACNRLQPPATACNRLYRFFYLLMPLHQFERWRTAYRQPPRQPPEDALDRPDRIVRNARVTACTAFYSRIGFLTPTHRRLRLEWCRARGNWTAAECY